MTRSHTPRALGRRLGLRALLCSLCALAALPLPETAEAQQKTGKPKSRTEQARTASSSGKSTKPKSSTTSTASKSKKSGGSQSSTAKKSEPARPESGKAKSASTRSSGSGKAKKAAPSASTSAKKKGTKETPARQAASGARKSTKGKQAKSEEARKESSGKKPSAKESRSASTGSAKKKQGTKERETRVAKKDSGSEAKGTQKEPRPATAKKKDGSTGSRLAAAVRAGSTRSRQQRSRVLGEVLGGPRLENLSRLGGRLVVPVAGVRPERLRDSYTEGRSDGRVHHAIDIHAPRGTPVVAVADGRIVKLHDGARGGLSIYHLDEDGRTRYYYAHLDRYAEGLREGQSVKQGEVIGYVGDTGNATPGDFHLHFSVALLRDARRWWDGVNLNPYPLLARN